MEVREASAKVDAKDATFAAVSFKFGTRNSELARNIDAGMAHIPDSLIKLIVLDPPKGNLQIVEMLTSN
jgi:hypothetical protein